MPIVNLRSDKVVNIASPSLATDSSGKSPNGRKQATCSLMRFDASSNTEMDRLLQLWRHSNQIFSAVRRLT